MAKRKSLSKKTRFEVFKRDKFTCQYCGKSAPGVILHVDHITPVSEGGSNDLTNLVTACADCNLGKSNVMLSDDSAVMVQKKQFDEIAERREQVEMMHQWEVELAEERVFEARKISEIVEILCPRYLPNEDDEATFMGLIDKFGYPVVSSATRTAFSIYPTSDNYERSVAIGKIGGICYNQTHRTCKQCVNRIGYRSEYQMYECGRDGSQLFYNNYAEECDGYESRYGGDYHA